MNLKSTLKNRRAVKKSEKEKGSPRQERSIICLLANGEELS
jgi:hypothetical protein